MRSPGSPVNSTSRQSSTDPLALAVGLALIGLGVTQAAIGLWAVVSPRGWFGQFPGFASHWLADYGPYNEHLAFDVGTAYIAQAVLLLGAAATMHQRLVIWALVSYAVQSVPHAIFHWIHDGVLGSGDRLLNGILVGLTVVVPAIALVAARLSRPLGARRVMTSTNPER